MYLNIKGPLLGQALVCEPILRSLPEWFGIEEAIVRYLAEIASLPVFPTYVGVNRLAWVVARG